MSSAAEVGASKAGAPACAGTAQAEFFTRAADRAAERRRTRGHRGGRPPGSRFGLSFKRPETWARRITSSAAEVGSSSPRPEGTAGPEMFIKSASPP